MILKQVGPAALAVAAMVALAAAPAGAQTNATPQKQVGRSGAVQLSLSGNFSKDVTSGNESPGTIQVQVGLGRFLTDNFVVQFDLLGAGSIGGGESVTPTMFGQFGVLYYFSPTSVTSPYGGADYFFQMTNRSEGDNGYGRGKFGVQTALSPHSSFFLEASYGVSLASVPAGASRPQEFGSQFGLRFLF